MDPFIKCSKTSFWFFMYLSKICTTTNERGFIITGYLETNEPYAIAKIAGIKMCESYNRQYGRDIDQ